MTLILLLLQFYNFRIFIKSIIFKFSIIFIDIFILFRLLRNIITSTSPVGTNLVCLVQFKFTSLQLFSLKPRRRKIIGVYRNMNSNVSLNYSARVLMRNRYTILVFSLLKQNFGSVDQIRPKHYSMDK